MTTPNTNHSTVSFTDLSEAKAYATTQTFTEPTYLVKVLIFEEMALAHIPVSDTFNYLFMTADKMTEDGYVYLPSGNLWSPKGYQDGSTVSIVQYYQN